MLRHRAASKSRSSLPRALGGSVRGIFSKGPRPLKTTDDWLEFQRDRADRKRLMDMMGNYGSTQTPGKSWTMRKSLHEPSGNATLGALLASGAHFGHNTAIMESNFMPYAYGSRAGITLIDMDHTLPLLRRAAKMTRAVALSGGSIVFVGTRPDLRPIVEKAAERVGVQGYHVGERWIPGTLTNRFQLFGESTIQAEQVIPDLVIFLNPLANLSAIRECAFEHVPTVGIIDSNADPRLVMYAIPANDESTRTAELVAGILSMAAKEGATQRVALAEQSRNPANEREEDELVHAAIAESISLSRSPILHRQSHEQAVSSSGAEDAASISDSDDSDNTPKSSESEVTEESLMEEEEIEEDEDEEREYEHDEDEPEDEQEYEDEGIDEKPEVEEKVAPWDSNRRPKKGQYKTKFSWE